MKFHSPVLVLAYNRPLHLRNCLESLRRNLGFEEHEIFIAIDGIKNESERSISRQVENVAEEFAIVNENTRVVKNARNLGLGASVLHNIDKILDKNLGIIVVEDDLVLSSHFLNFCEYGLVSYLEDKSVMAISGFSLPIGTLEETYFLRGADCWGWATWKDRWDKFERDGSLLLRELKKRKLQRVFDLDYSYQYTSMLERQVAGKSSSWAIRWHASTFLQGGLSLFPKVSLVENRGNDGSGTNMGITEIYSTSLENESPVFEKIQITESRQAREKLIDFYKKKFPQNLKSRLKNFICSLYFSDSFR